MPEPTKNIIVQVPAEKHKKLKELSVKKEVSMRKLLIHCIEKLIESLDADSSRG